MIQCFAFFFVSHFTQYLKAIKKIFLLSLLRISRKRVHSNFIVKFLISKISLERKLFSLLELEKMKRFRLGIRIEGHRLQTVLALTIECANDSVLDFSISWYKRFPSC